jgi:hypothetical protein
MHASLMLAKQQRQSLIFGYSRSSGIDAGFPAFSKLVGEPLVSALPFMRRRAAMARQLTTPQNFSLRATAVVSCFPSAEVLLAGCHSDSRGCCPVVPGALDPDDAVPWSCLYPADAINPKLKLVVGHGGSHR